MMPLVILMSFWLFGFVAGALAAFFLCLDGMRANRAREYAGQPINKPPP